MEENMGQVKIFPTEGLLNYWPFFRRTNKDTLNTQHRPVVQHGKNALWLKYFHIFELRS